MKRSNQALPLRRALNPRKSQAHGVVPRCHRQAPLSLPPQTLTLTLTPPPLPPSAPPRPTSSPSSTPSCGRSSERSSRAPACGPSRPTLTAASPTSRPSSFVTSTSASSLALSPSLLTSPATVSPSPMRASSTVSLASLVAARSPASPPTIPSSSTSPPPDSRPYLAFTAHMESLLEEERALMDAMEPQHVTTVHKLLMLSGRRRIPLAKLHHCRLLFGLLDDFRDCVRKYPDFFPITVNPNGRHVLELVEWDTVLVVSAMPGPGQSYF